MFTLKIYDYHAFKYNSNDASEQQDIIKFHDLVNQKKFLKAVDFLWEKSGKKCDFVMEEIDANQGLNLALKYHDADFAIKMIENGADIFNAKFLDSVNHGLYNNKINKSIFGVSQWSIDKAFGIKLYLYFKTHENDDQKFSQILEYLQNHNNLDDNSAMLQNFYDNNIEEFNFEYLKANANDYSNSLHEDSTISETDNSDPHHDIASTHDSSPEISTEVENDVTINSNTDWK